jgi:hypothetical protein
MMIFGIDKPTRKLIQKMISRFLSELGEDHESILTYCLGPNWKTKKIGGSHIHFNKKLGTDLKGSDDIIESGRKIKKAWQSIKRDNLLNEILS